MPTSPNGDRNPSEIDWFSHEDTEHMQEDEQQEQGQQEHAQQAQTTAQRNQGSGFERQTNQLAAALFDNPSEGAMHPLVMGVMQSRTELPFLGKGGVPRYTPVPHAPLTVQPRAAGARGTNKQQDAPQDPEAPQQNTEAMDSGRAGGAATAAPFPAPERKRKRSCSPCSLSGKRKRQRAHSEPVSSPPPESESKRAHSEPPARR